MDAIRDLTPIEQRILGALLEKSLTTPDYYPLTLNSLIAACNQKSNRDPVSSHTEAEVAEALENLRADVLAWRSESARSVKWSESITRRLGFDDAQRALITLLLLRGPQTPGELRSRSGRLYTFGGLGVIDDTLRSMVRGNDPLVVELERAPGQKERRWAHLLGGPVEDSQVEGPPPASVPQSTQGHAAPVRGNDRLEARLGQLEERVTDLAARLESLEGRLVGLLD